MKPKFNINITEFKTIEELETAWTVNDYKNLLELFEFEGINDINENEIFDYLALTIQDLEPNESAEVILKYKLGNKLNDNQIKQIAHDMPDEPLWEEYQDMSLHEELFNANSLLFKVYNGKFPHPEAIRLALTVEATNHDAKLQLQKEITEAFVCRILSSAMDEHSVLIRLFDEQIAGHNFPEAKDIIWTMKSQKNENITEISLITSLAWVKQLKNVKDYESLAYHDEDISSLD